MDSKKINFDILRETYDKVDGKTVCTLNCKISLMEFERKNFSFTEHFIKEKIGNWLPTIKTIYNYSLKNPIIGKFYILPSAIGYTAKVIEYNTEYYSQYRHIPSDKLLNKGDIINIKSIPGVYRKVGETSDITYTETFKITGVSKCHPDDSYNESTGSYIALNKAMTKLNKYITGLYTAICGLTEPITKSIYNKLDVCKTQDNLLKSNLEVLINKSGTEK